LKTAKPTAYALEARPSRIDGTGVFARQAVPVRRKLGEMTGEVVTWAVARRRAKLYERIAMVEFEDGYALDATHDTLLRFVNHSCDANCYIRRNGHRVEFYTRRALAPGEELTADYGETHHDGKHPCHCGAGKCRGFL
jgi:uncharacterized protein